MGKGPSQLNCARPWERPGGMISSKSNMRSGENAMNNSHIRCRKCADLKLHGPARLPYMALPQN